MSTKIYTGFRLNGYSLEQVFHKLQAFRSGVLLPAAQLACHRRMVGEAVALLDAWRFGLEAEKSERNPMAEAWVSVMERVNEISKTRRRDPAVDFDFEVTLFPAEGAILGISFTEQSEFHALWLAQSDVEDYGYWNNTDKPDEVSDAEWDARAAAWDEALAGGPTPAQAGLSLTLCLGGDLLAFPVQSVTGLLPSFDSRVHAVTQDCLLDAWEARQPEEPGLPAMRAYRLFKSWRSSPEGQAEQRVLEEAVTARLVKDVTLDLLLGRAGQPPLY